MEKRTVTASQARRFLILLALFLVVIFSVSLVVDLQGIEQNYQNLAAEVGRSFYRAINAMRGWNLEQDGVYVRVTSQTLPSPYLHHPLRNLETSQGLKLTMINHAQMTRLLSELLTDTRGVHLHITSLRPIRPANGPDEWEGGVLADFEGGAREAYHIEGTGSGATFRYMAPLPLQPLCLACHPGEQGANRKTLGAIGVSFSYVPFQDVMSRSQGRTILLHVIFLAVGLCLIVLMGHRLTRSILELQESMLHIKQLEGMLPICARCKKIRLKDADQAKQDSWVPIEKYIQDRTDAEFTHGFCPQCARELYPGIPLEGAPSS